MKIELTSKDGKDVMQFINCSINLPAGNGLFFISAGCGSGKTTITRDIIKKRHNEGILVVAATIEAAEDLRAKIPLTVNAVILHSGENSQNELATYWKNPAFLESKEVVVITSARLQMDPPSLFVSYNGKYRGLIIVDEMINFYPPVQKYPSELESILTYIDKQPLHEGHSGKQLANGYYKHIYQDIQQMEAAYKASHLKIFSQSNALTKYKLRYLFSHIKDVGFTPIKISMSYFSAISQVLLLDGTIDCLTDNKDKRLLPVNGSRYGSNISFQDFSLPFRRKGSLNLTQEQMTLYLERLITIVKNEVKNGLVLIVTWMHLYGQSGGTTVDDLEKEEAKDDSFPKMIAQCLVSSGIEPNKFSVIYRGSGRDRGSNEFRDYSSIIFMGEWYIDNSIVSEINRMFGLKCTYDQYMESLLIQTICRTRIRQHQGLPIHVYFSDDLNRMRMFNVQEYFKRNSPSTCNISGIQEPVKIKTLPEKKALVDLVLLYSVDPKLRAAVENSQPYQFNITLDKLYSILPKGRKAKDRYTTLINYLKQLSITMTIT